VQGSRADDSTEDVELGGTTMEQQQATTWARITCDGSGSDGCGVVRVRTDTLVLRVGVHDGVSQVRFACPRCHRVELQPLDDEATVTLLFAGVATEWWDLPAELSEPHDGPPLTEIDLAAWQAMLADDLALAAALAS
jgi:hypothetical protein